MDLPLIASLDLVYFLTVLDYFFKNPETKKGDVKQGSRTFVDNQVLYTKLIFLHDYLQPIGF